MTLAYVIIIALFLLPVLAFLVGRLSALEEMGRELRER